MIDVKNLMLGNFVKDKSGDIMLVGKIHRDSVADKWGGIAFDDEIEGIPVTKEILKDIGFEEYEDLPLEGVFFRYWNKDYKYKLDVRDFWTNSQRRWYIHIDNDVCNTIGSGEFDYIHELQNLVRVITGYELPVDKYILGDV
jgi:hypothetical protein